MSESVGPDVPPAEQIGLSAREANWASKVERLQVDPRTGVRGTNVAGRRLTGPIQGFGKMWEKTYRISVPATVTPQQAIATWKAHFPEFWPKGTRFAGALAGISPGDVALLDLAIGGGVKLSTGVFVLYADEESFTFMTPQGHMFAGWITFSAEPDGDATAVQAHVLMRASDPLYEVAMTFGGHSKEDGFWADTLKAVGRRLGAGDVEVTTKSTCVDQRRQWRQAGNVWHNSMIRSLGQTLTSRRHGRRAGGAPDEHRAGGAPDEHRAGGAPDEHRAGGAPDEQ